MSSITTHKIKNGIIGIDLGTTNSCIAAIQDGKPIIIQNEEGKKTTPSIVFLGKNKILVGDEAKDKLITDPKRTIFASKRLICRKFDDPEIKKYLKSLPYDTFSHTNGDVWIKVDNKYSPTQIGAMVLTKLKNVASKFAGEEIRRSVITVPAYFDDSQRQATKDAGRIAGLDVVRVINEPTAAALAYGLDKSAKGIIAVYDLGGGTFDISILELDDGIFHVKATNGNTFLGGEDLDNELVNYIASKLMKDYKDVKLRDEDRQKIKKAAENAKICLSTSNEAEINIPDIETIDKKVIGVTQKLTRDELEKVAEKIILKTIEPCEKAIRDAGIKKSDIKHVILVGGMTRMPLVKKLVEKIFKVNPTTDVNPDEAVAIGAALQGGVLTGSIEDVLLLDVAPLSLGIELQGGVFNKIIKRNTTVPFKETQIFSTSEDDQTDVDIKIYQGERPLVRDNKYLGAIKLTNIPPAPRGVPKIAVSFESDANGILRVTAHDNVTKKEQSMEVIPSSGLTELEIQTMVKESESKRAIDERRLMNIEFLLEAENYIRRNGGRKEAICKFRKFCSNPDFDIDRAKELFDAVKGE